MFRKILVAVDGSTHGERALAEAIDLAKSSQAELTVMAVVPDPSTWLLSGSAFEAFDVTEIEREVHEKYEQMLDAAKQTVPDEITSTALLADGHVSEQILKAAADGHDLIVMGSRGRSGLESAVLGSVSHQVLNASPGAVLVIHADAS